MKATFAVLILSIFMFSNSCTSIDDVKSSETGIVFDCDPGTDDAMALKLLSTEGFAPNWCVSTFGNMTGDYTNRNLNILTRLFGLQSKLAVGTKEPYDGHIVSCGDFHGADGLADKSDSLFHALGLTQKDLESNATIKDLADYICSREKVTYIVVGPLATLSHLIMDYPETTDHIEKVYIMGGGIRRFNKDEDKEYNFAGDGIAVKNVFDSPLDITLFPLDITEEYALVNMDRINSINYKKCPVIRNLILKNFRSNSEITGIDAAVLHDCLPVLSIQNPSKFVVEDMRLKADTTGHIELFSSGRLVHVAVSCPEDLLFEMLKSSIER